MSLQVLKEVCNSCTKCELYKGNKQSAIYRGNPLTAKIVFIAEALGSRETELGLPLVGPAGQLFQRAIDKIGLTEDDFLCTNMAIHQPPANRVPTKEELDACHGYLVEIVNTVEPKIICLLGNTPLKYLHPLKDKIGITSARGSWFSTSFGASIYTTTCSWHPSYCLRHEGSEKGKALKEQFWRDLLKTKELVNL